VSFRFGIEHEVAFLNAEGRFVDSTQGCYDEFAAIIDRLPLHESDYPQLRVGDAKIRHKRWYVEGLERFSDTGEALGYAAKGIEIRTTIHTSISGAVEELAESFALLRDEAARFGFTPVLTSFNPYQAKFIPDPPFNAFELAELAENPDEQTAHIHMVSYGPDLNLSVVDMPVSQLIDIGQKLTYYSPFIVPFSFSSPFYDGDLWDGLSVRTFLRTGARAAAYVFVGSAENIIPSVPSMTKLARIPAEVGRIEFKAFDSSDDFSLYAALLALLKGLVLDQTLPGRALVPDAKAHQHAARKGLADEAVLAQAWLIVQAAEAALGEDSDAGYLQLLKNRLESASVKSHQLISHFDLFGSIESALLKTYQASSK
jgi:hypothetical protein